VPEACRPQSPVVSFSLFPSRDWVGCPLGPSLAMWRSRVLRGQSTAVCSCRAPQAQSSSQGQRCFPLGLSSGHSVTKHPLPPLPKYSAPENAQPMNRKTFALHVAEIVDKCPFSLFLFLFFFFAMSICPLLLLLSLNQPCFHVSVSVRVSLIMLQ
jgi:hypothetical protein